MDDQRKTRQAHTTSSESTTETIPAGTATRPPNLLPTSTTASQPAEEIVRGASSPSGDGLR